MQLAPDLSRSVLLFAFIVGALDFVEDLGVPFGLVGGISGVAGNGGMPISGRRSDRQDAAGRLDSAGVAMLFDESDRLRNGRSSSARAKQADAFFRISLAVRNSLFSRSGSLILALSALLRLGGPLPGAALRLDAPLAKREAGASELLNGRSAGRAVAGTTDLRVRGGRLVAWVWLSLRHGFLPSSFRLICLADCSPEPPGQFNIVAEYRPCHCRENRNSSWSTTTI